MLGVVAEGIPLKRAADTGGVELGLQRGIGIAAARRPDHVRTGMAHRAGGKVDGSAVGPVGAADVQHQHIIDIHEHIVVSQKLEYHVLAADPPSGGHIEVEFHGHPEPQVHGPVRQPVGGQRIACRILLGSVHRVKGKEIPVERLRIILLRCFAVGLDIAGIVGPQQEIPQPEHLCIRIVPCRVLQGVVTVVPLVIPLEQPRTAAVPHGVGLLARHRRVRIEQILQAAAAILRCGPHDSQHLRPAVFQRGLHYRPVVAPLQHAVLGVLIRTVAERQHPPVIAVDRAGVIEQAHGHVIRYHSSPQRLRPQGAAVLLCGMCILLHGVRGVLRHAIRAGAGGVCRAVRQQSTGCQHQRQQSAQYPQPRFSVPVHSSSSCVHAASSLPFTGIIASRTGVSCRKRFSAGNGKNSLLRHILP